MSKESLQNKTVQELRAIAKEKGVTGRWDMTKEQLVDALACENVESVESVEVKEEATADDKKMKYVESVKIGTIVAFKMRNGKVKSAKVARKSTKNRKLKLITSYGAEYVVSYDDIVWVRTGKRWPKFVYNIMKGIDDEKEES